MIEQLKLKPEITRRPVIAPELAVRAVAICEGCPLATLCKQRDSGVCPSSAELPELQMIDMGGAEPTSYRTQLLDDSVGTVMANLVPVRPKVQPVVTTPLPRRTPPRAKQSLPMQTRQTKQPLARTQPARRGQVRYPQTPHTSGRETLGDALADVFALALGRRAVGARHNKR